MLFIIAGIVTFIVWAYVLFVREWAERKFPDSFYSKVIHQAEDKLWLNSRQILVGRLYWVGSIVLAIHELAISAGYDMTPLTKEIAAFIPENYRGFALALALFLTGIGIEWLRRVTTQPLSEK